MEMAVAPGDEPSYPGFCGIKWGHMIEGMWDSHVLMREIKGQAGTHEAHVLATKVCLVYLNVNFKHC